jgi:Flp pilus assembly protein TadD/uncharacterized caspase-like protein
MPFRLSSVLLLLTISLQAQIPALDNAPRKTWAVITGISDYQDKGISDLQYAHRDAQAFYEFLRSPAGGEVPAEQISLLLNEQATNAAVSTALYELMNQAGEGDWVYIFFAGHGDVETKAMLGFLLPWNSPPRVYAAGAIHLSFLQQVIATLAQQNKARVMMIADACRSGNLAGSATGGPQATTQNLQAQYANEIKILACGPNEFSLEGPQWGGGRGAFSYHLIEGLQGLADADGNYTVSLYELSRYLDDRVPAETANKQLPMVFPYPDRNTALALVDPEVLAQLQETKASSNPVFDAIAARSNGLAPTDSLGLQLYEAYQKALAEKRLLFPEENSAYYFYTQLAAQPEYASLEGTLRNNLAVALQDDAQQAINTYLESDPKEMARRWKDGSAGYAHIPAYLEKAVEIVGEAHYITPHLQAQKLYFEALLIRMEAEEKNRKELLTQALDKIRQALLLEPNGAHLYNEQGLIYGALQETGQEIQSYQQAYELAPAWVMPAYNLSVVYKDLGSADTATYWLETALKSNPDFAPLHTQKGVVLHFLEGNFEEAEKAYRKSIELDSTISWTYTNLASLCYDQQDYAQAEHYAQKAIQNGADDPVLFYTLGNIRLNSGQAGQARGMYEQTIRLEPQHPYAHFGLGIALERSGEISRAIEAYAKNFEITPGYPVPCISIAALYALQNEPGKALDWLQKGLEHGYANKGNLEENEDFDSLRELPRFRELMNAHFQE